MKHFCTKCGKPTIYALALPKFCSQCGSEFSLVTKQKDQSVQDQAIEKLKDKYPTNVPEFAPTTKGEPKNFPNPARASFKIINDDTDSYNNDDHYDTEEDTLNIDASQFHKIKPKFTIQKFTQSSQSFENLLTQSYASNYKPLSPEELKSQNGITQEKSADCILQEFQKEAGSIRSNNQE